MQSIELTAKSVEEARKIAAESLGVSPSDVNITVLEETKGLFGRTNYKVRAEAAPAPAAVVEAPAAAPVAETPAVEEAPKRGRGRPKKLAEVAPEPTPAEPVVAEAPAEDAPQAPAPGDPVATPENAKEILAIVDELVESAGLEVDTQIGEVQGRYVAVSLSGKDASYLVGKHGEVLNALQYLVNVIAGRRFDNGIRATIDANDYRAAREEEIVKRAEAIAAKVIELNQEALFEALPAFERRLIHKAIADIDGVETYSEGEEPNRRVVISPRGA